VRRALASVPMTVTLALQLAIAGISVGSIYALVALAIVIPFKASGVLNFGQGEVVTFGAYAALVLTTVALPYPVVLASVLLLGAVGGVVIERALIRPIVKAPEFTLVIATFAIGLLIKGLLAIRFGDSPASLDGPFGTDPLLFGGLRFNPTSVWIFACTLLVTFSVIAFFRHTRLGKAMRAVSISPEAARLMGIRVETVYRWSWAISTAIGALAGLLVAPLIGINPEIGQLILRGLLAAVIGGFTSIPGALVGGLAVGLIETFAGVTIGSTFKNLVPFLLLMLLLVFRPQGLFGAAEIKRV
jgi:branched-chain amino acid transport system permease protein